MTMTIANTTPRGHAYTADEYLTAAGQGITSKLHYKTDADPARQLAALQGIGWALLAVVDQLSDSNDTVADVAAHLEQLAMTADDLASDAAEVRVRRARRAWWRRVPKAGSEGPASCGRCHASGDDVTLVIYAPGIAYCSNIRACLARQHGEVVLPASDAATVRQALADAQAWRMVALAPDGACGCSQYRDDDRCPDHVRDAGLAASYAALRARLGEG
jgi:hypothetical protein